MKTCRILLSALATIASLACVAPCGASGPDGASAETLELNKSITRRVYEEGLNQGRFDVPYRDDFVGHGGRRTFTHADGMTEARGWREAFPVTARRRSWGRTAPSGSTAASANIAEAR